MKIKISSKNLFIILSVLTSGWMLIFYDNKIASYLLVGLEIIFLFYYFCKRKILKYVCYYLIFISTSLEMSTSVGTDIFYSIKNIRIAGLNLGIWLLIPLWVMIFIRPIKLKNLEEKTPHFYQMTKMLIYMNVCAALFGIVLIVFNDNNIRNMDGVFSAYIETIYSYMLITISMFAAFYVIVIYDLEHIHEVQDALYASLCGSVFELILSRGLNIVGHYGSEEVLLASIIYVFLPFMLLLSTNRKRTISKILNFLISIVGIVVLITNNGGGKIYLSFILVVILLFVYGITNESISKVLVWGVGFCIFVIALPMLMSYLATYTNKFSKDKLDVVMDLLMFWKDNWLYALDYSPRSRIGEVINICIEYIKKPWLLPLGKGYVGSVLDYSGILSTAPNRYVELAAYTKEQWKNGTFYRMHEITNIVLCYGVLGINYIIRILKLTVHYSRENIWLIFAAYWFIFYYGYSFTISTFGVILFCYSLIRIDYKFYE